MFPRWSDFDIQYTRKGLIKYRISQTLRVVVLIATIVGAYYIRKDVRGGLLAVRTLLRQRVKSTLFSILGVVQKAVSKLPG